MDIKITFTPYALGSSVVTVRLHVGQYGFTPRECCISAVAVSGLIESSQMLVAEKKVVDHILSKTDKLSRLLQRINFKGDDEAAAAATAEIIQNTVINKTATSTRISTKKSHPSNPIGTVLAKTFQFSNANEVFSQSVGPTNLLKLGSAASASGDLSLTHSVVLSPWQSDQESIPRDPALEQLLMREVNG